MNKIVIISIVLVVLYACKPTSEGLPVEPSGEYSVQTLKGDSVVTRKMTLNFNPEKNLVNGSGGCNQYNASYTLSERNIKFTTPTATKMMCPEGSTSEYDFFKALQATTRYEMNREEIKLYNSTQLMLTARLNK